MYVFWTYQETLSIEYMPHPYIYIYIYGKYSIECVYIYLYEYFLYIYIYIFIYRDFVTACKKKKDPQLLKSIQAKPESSHPHHWADQQSEQSTSTGVSEHGSRNSTFPGMKDNG